MGTLSTRRILVTGAARRIGRAMALALARAGADVAVHHGSSKDEALEVVREIEALGRRSVAVQGDLADPGNLDRIVDEAADALGGLDALINNASLFDKRLFADTTPEEWDRMIAVNARAPFLLGRALSRVLPHDTDGDIIHLNDIHCLRPKRDSFAYTQSKALLHSLTGTMALALAPRIRVNAVALGAVLPPNLPPGSPESVELPTPPLGRLPALDDVSAAVIYLLGARSTTGETIRIDGGQHLFPA